MSGAHCPPVAQILCITEYRFIAQLSVGKILQINKNAIAYEAGWCVTNCELRGGRTAAPTV
jgi:hypothetical protein